MQVAAVVPGVQGQVLVATVVAVMEACPTQSI